MNLLIKMKNLQILSPENKKEKVVKNIVIDREEMNKSHFLTLAKTFCLQLNIWNFTSFQDNVIMLGSLHFMVQL